MFSDDQSYEYQKYEEIKKKGVEHKLLSFD